MPNGTGTISQMNLNVNGTTTITNSLYSLNFNNDNGIKTFNGLVVLNDNTNFTSTTIVTPGNLVFNNGISVGNGGSSKCRSSNILCFSNAFRKW